VVITEAGLALLDHARRAVEEADAARSASQAVADVVAGGLSVVSLRTFVGGMARLVARFHQSFPAVVVQLHDPEGDAGVATLVRDGDCELGVIRMLNVPDDLEVTSIGFEETVIALPPGSRHNQRTFITLQEVSELTMVAPPVGNPIRTAFDLAFSTLGFRPRVVVEAAHQESALALVQAGVGACLASRDNADLAGHGCVVLPLEWPIAVELGVAHLRGPLSPAAAAFKRVAVTPEEA
jgi:DNA-binding transcriptional LysR family regulator